MLFGEDRTSPVLCGLNLKNLQDKLNVLKKHTLECRHCAVSRAKPSVSMEAIQDFEDALSDIKDFLSIETRYSSQLKKLKDAIGVFRDVRRELLDNQRFI